MERQGQWGLNYPTGICIDSDETVYVVKGHNHCISVFTHKGDFLISFGSKGNGPGQFKEPHGIIVDKEGTIYVTDRDNNCTQIF